jgi:hypothetical protein
MTYILGDANTGKFLLRLLEKFKETSFAFNGAIPRQFDELKG